jgi:hypothetical protein
MMVVAAFLLAAAMSPAPSQSELEQMRVVACRALVCEASMPRERDHADFAWIWTDASAPIRIE